jgi:hypothetical protein
MRRIAQLIVPILALAGSVFGQVLADSFGKLPDDDVYARVDHFGGEVQKSHRSIGHAVVYKGRSEPLGAFLRYFYGIQSVWKLRGYPEGRLVLHPGEERNILHHEFWLVTKGERIQPRESSIEERLSQPLTAKTIFDTQCIGCAPAVLLYQWIFREGLDYYGQALRANKGAKADITIGINEFVSGTSRERAELRSEILKVLVNKYGVPKNHIRIRFIRSMFARLYIIPATSRRS